MKCQLGVWFISLVLLFVVVFAFGKENYSVFPNTLPLFGTISCTENLQVTTTSNQIVFLGSYQNGVEGPDPCCDLSAF